MAQKDNTTTDVGQVFDYVTGFLRDSRVSSPSFVPQFCPPADRPPGRDACGAAHRGRQRLRNPPNNQFINFCRSKDRTATKTCAPPTSLVVRARQASCSPALSLAAPSRSFAIILTCRPDAGCQTRTAARSSRSALVTIVSLIVEEGPLQHAWLTITDG
jgi:hypothetical protein